MAKRVKVIKQSIETREEMERLVGEIAQLVIDGDAVAAELDGRLLEIRVQYEQRLTELAEAVDAKLPVAQDWAERNREAFGNRKSIEGVHATFGFRTGMPSLKTMSGWKWDSVLKSLKLLGRKDLIRNKEEIDKDAIIAELKSTKAETWPAVGVKVAQAESFFVEPKMENVTQG